MMSALKIGDIVSWDGDSWTVVECGCDREPLEDLSEGGFLACIENHTRGRYTVLESDLTITAWAPEPVARKGGESRPQ